LIAHQQPGHDERRRSRLRNHEDHHSENDESLHVPDSPGQRINFMTAELGSDTADRLRRLAVG
jgi:hypothetical protein